MSIGVIYFLVSVKIFKSAFKHVTIKKRNYFVKRTSVTPLNTDKVLLLKTLIKKVV